MDQQQIDRHLGDVPGSCVMRNPDPRDPRYPEQGAGYRVIFLGKLQRPCFNSKGAAVAFLAGLQSGSRKPEPV